MIEFRRILACLAVVFAFVASSAFALPARVIHGDITQLLSDVPAGGRVTLRNIELGRESLDHLELEPMEVWAKDARIIVYGPGGTETIIPPPAIQYFKGRVIGEDDSLVFVSMSADGSVRGMVMIGERRWTMGTGVRKSAAPKKGSNKIDREAPILISENDPFDDVLDPAGNWQCEVGKHPSGEMMVRRSDLKPQAAGKPVIPTAGNVSGATYQLRIAIETDNEFCTAFGNNDTTITTYIGDLVGKASVVYSRDVNTTLVLGAVNLRSAGADPWTATSAAPALAEFAAYWHANYSLGYPANNGGPAGAGTAVARSSAVFLSGKLTNSGIAWIDLLCSDNFYCGASGLDCSPDGTYANSYAGAYAFNGSSSSSGVTTTVPDPTLTVNGVQYGLPTSGNYWMLLEFLHELGHNVASPHPNCVPLSPAEQATYGVARSFVDQCFGSDFFSGGPCYSGSTSIPAEKGSIMSYCHLFTYDGTHRASRYLLGKAGEPSEKMFPIFKNGFGGISGLEGCTANATITTQGEPIGCTAGRTASVTSCSGCTYAWQISGGTITSSTTTNAITYTPTQPNVTLTVTVITSRGCGITASKTVATSCAAISAPTGVTATATATTTVQVVWNSVVGAASYNVYRSTDGTNYSPAGSTTAPTTTFNDTGRSPNTSYLYTVRAVSGSESGDSNRDLATTVIFIDDPLVQFSTLIQAVHITQLRTAVDAVRAMTSLGAGSYTTDPTINVGSTTAKAAHITELRTALDAGRSNLTLSAQSYGETPTALVTSIKASHITELRNGVK